MIGKEQVVPNLVGDDRRERAGARTECPFRQMHNAATCRSSTSTGITGAIASRSEEIQIRRIAQVMFGFGKLRG